MGLLVALPVLTKDIGQLGTRAFFSCRQPRAGQRHGDTRLKRSVAQIEQVQRAGGGAQLGLANLQIALGTLQRVMTQQCLNGHQVHATF